MVDLTREMADLMSALGKPQGSRGRVLMFVSAFSGEGVSTMAREYARCEAAFAKKPVWLIDADLHAQSQMKALADDPARFGPPGKLAIASPDGSVFFRTVPPGRDADGQPIGDDRYLVARPFLDRRLWVTRLRENRLATGQRVKVQPKPDYWQALRGYAQTVIVDAPSLDRATAALQLAPFMDGVILVVSETQGDVQGRVDLKADIEDAGGRLLGMVYNRARQPAKGLVRRPAGGASLARAAAL